MKKLLAGLATGIFLFLIIGVANATPVNWIDWDSTTSGTLTIGGQSIGVTLTGNPMDHVDGDEFYNNSYTGGTSSDGTYGGLMPSDLIRINDGGTFTLKFDSAIIDPYMSLVSVGRDDLPVSYEFNDSFSVISSGANQWGYTGYEIAGNTFTGKEFNGILQFKGAFDSITFSTDPNEYWHGFNFGTPVPEPGTMLLLGIGLLSLAGVNRKTKL